MGDLSSLKAFHGTQTTLIQFTSGYYLYLASWDSSPTRFPSFSNVWLTTPDDRRMIFADPPDSSKIALIYHDFQEVHGASISVDWASEEHLQVQCASLGGEHELSFELFLRETPGSRLVAAIAGSPPNRFMLSRPMVAFSNFVVNRLVTKGGVTVLGRTETGQPFYTGVVERLMLVKKGSATLNGRDLGQVSSPTWPVEFGDFVPAVQPVVRLGALYIPYEEEMLSSA